MSPDYYYCGNAFGFSKDKDILKRIVMFDSVMEAKNYLSLLDAGHYVIEPFYTVTTDVENKVLIDGVPEEMSASMGKIINKYLVVLSGVEKIEGKNISNLERLMREIRGECARLHIHFKGQIFNYDEEIK